MTSIGEGAFMSCSKLSIVYCKPITPPNILTNYSNDTELFYSTSSNLIIYVPSSSVSLYKNAKYWEEYEYKFMSYDF